MRHLQRLARTACQELVVQWFVASEDNTTMCASAGASFAPHAPTQAPHNRRPHHGPCLSHGHIDGR